MLLREIDGIIRNRQTYGAEKEARISDLKKLLSEATSDEQRYGFCGRLFDEYRAYNLDSSYVYAQRKQGLASHLNKQDYLDDAAMNMAEVMGTTGMYKEALEQLGQIDKKTLSDYLYPYYYHLYRTIYGLMGDYAVTEKEKKEYYRMTDLYRDSLLQTNASDSLGHVLVMADKCTVHAQYDQAITMLTDFYRKPSLDDHSKAMITYTLSEAYRLKGDKKGQKHFLALSAIADLKSAVKEYVSLRKLASLVYEDGDIDRAYNYLKCSLEDATLCNARLRTLEISQVFPIIDQAYQLKTKRQQQDILSISSVIVTPPILLSPFIFTIVYILSHLPLLVITEKYIDCLGGCPVHLWGSFQLLHARLPDCFDCLERPHQRLTARWSDALDIIQHGAHLLLAPETPVVLDRKPVRLVLNPGDQLKSFRMAIDWNFHILIIQSPRPVVIILYHATDRDFQLKLS